MTLSQHLGDFSYDGVWFLPDGVGRRELYFLLLSRIKGRAVFERKMIHSWHPKQPSLFTGWNSTWEMVGNH